MKLLHAKIKFNYFNFFLFVLVFNTNLFSLKSFAATITSSTSGNWSNTTTWVGGVVPGSSDNVVIASGHNVTVDANSLCTSIVINAPAGSSSNSLILNSGISLTISGSLTASTTTASSTSTIAVGAGVLNVGSISMSSITSNTRITRLTISTGTVNCTGNLTSSNAATSKTEIVFSGNGILNIAGVFNSGCTTFTPSTGTVNFNGSSAQTVPNYSTFYNLKSNNIAGVTLTAASTITTLTIGDVTSNSLFNDGGFTITPGASSVLNLTSGTYSLGSAGTATSWPAWATRNIAASTTVEYASGVSQAVSNTPSYPILKISGAGTKTAGGNLTITENLNVTAGVLDLSTFTANRSTSGGTITVANAATLKIGGTNTFPSNYTTHTLGSTSTVDYSGTNQTVANEAYGNLTLSGSGTKTMPSSAMVVSGILAMSGTTPSATLGATLSIGSLNQTAGTLNDGGFTITVIGTGSVWTKSGTFTTTGTTDFNGTTQSITGSNFNNLRYSGTSTLSMGTVTITVAGTFQVSNASGTVDVAATTLTVTGATTVTGTLIHSNATGTKIYVGLVNVSGTWNNSGNSPITFRGGITKSGTFTSGSGGYTFDSNNQTLTGTFNINSITVTSIILTNTNTLTVSTALSGTGSLRQGANSYLYITGTSAITTLDATTNTPNTVDYNGSAQTMHTNNYNNLTVSAAGIKTILAAVDVSGVLNLSNGTIDADGGDYLTISNTSSSAITGGSTTSYILGFVTWTLPSNLASGSTYTLPLGASSYLPVSVVNPTTGAGVVTIKLRAYSSNPGGSIDATLSSVGTSEYWSFASTGNFTNSSFSIGRASGITENVIGRSTTLAGVYSSICGDVSGYSVINSTVTSGAAQFLRLAFKIKPVTSPSATESLYQGGTLSWTAATGYVNGSNTTLVFAKSGSAITQGSPSNNVSTYTANAVFGSGTSYQNDASAFCIYKGDGTSVNLTGLNSGATYHFLIYTVIDASDATCTGKYFYSAPVTSSLVVHSPSKYYVDNNSNTDDVYTVGSAIGSNASAGTSAAPFATLTYALNIALPGDTIYVDAGNWSNSGTYINPHNYDLTKPNITIIGAGMQKTIFDDNMAGGNFYWMKIIANNITIKDLKVRQFNNTGSAHALYIGDGTNTYSNINFINLETNNNGASASSGTAKAIGIFSNTTSVFTGGGSDCNQPSTYNGSVWVSGTNIDVTFNNYSFVGNEGDGFGGNDGGGLYISGGNNTQVIKINNCVFQNNIASSDFNAMDIKMTSGNLTVNESSFINSKSKQTAGTDIGGAIEISGGTALFKNSKFYGIGAVTGNLNGAAIGNINGTVTVDSCYFSNNTATGANDIHNQSGTMIVTNTTIGEVGQVAGTFTISNSGNPIVVSGTVTKSNVLSPPSFVTPSTPTFTGTCAAGVVLPIELLDFDAFKVDYFAKITWSTASETNNNYFTIEKSYDGRNWFELTQVSSVGNTTRQTYYQFDDKTFMDVINYYRLSQTDYDGKSKTYSPKSVLFEKDKVEYIYRNVLGQEIDFENTPSGVYLKCFSDGTSIKVFKN